MVKEHDLEEGWRYADLLAVGDIPYNIAQEVDVEDMVLPLARVRPTGENERLGSRGVRPELVAGQEISPTVRLPPVPTKE